MNQEFQRQRPGLGLPIAAIWLTSLLCFSFPGRDVPNSVESLDFMAVVKLGVRVGTLVALGWLLVQSWRHPRRHVAAAALAPLGVYVLWAVISTCWSALPAVSLGQAMGLASLWLLAWSIAIAWRGSADTSRLLMHICLVFAAFSAVVATADVISHEASGLDRTINLDQPPASRGLVHPTTAGATASLGLVILCGAWALWGFRWSRYLLAPGAAMHVAVLVMAASRMAIFVALAGLATLVACKLRRTAFATLVLACCAIVVALLVCDPGWRMAGDLSDRVTAFLSRGEPAEQLKSLTGRTDLWDAIWKSYADAPLVGHGYFVTSKAGEIDVWEGPANRTAHNAALQVLVTTGAVGAALFALGLFWPICLSARAFLAEDDGVVNARDRAAARPLEKFLAIIVVWYACWSQLSESFMGPVQLESVVFFGLLGVATAQIKPELLARRALHGAGPLFMGGTQ